MLFRFGKLTACDEFFPLGNGCLQPAQKVRDEAFRKAQTFPAKVIDTKRPRELSLFPLQWQGGFLDPSDSVRRRRKES